jgi:hypothetical protein
MHHSIKAPYRTGKTRTKPNLRKLDREVTSMERASVRQANINKWTNLSICFILGISEREEKEAVLK